MARTKNPCDLVRPRCLTPVLTRSEVEVLLGDLCVGYGFCLPSAEHDKILANPPREVGQELLGDTRT